MTLVPSVSSASSPHIVKSFASPSFDIPRKLLTVSVSGNPRVMCWRMRLESVLDQKMRDLKTCLKNCVENFTPDDVQGRIDYVDTWFNQAELQDEVDVY